MKNQIRKAAAIIAVLAISLGFSIPTFAGSISISPESDTVNQGDTFTVYVTAYGEDIYNAYISVTCDDIFAGGTTDIISSDGGTSISTELTFTAIGSGTGNIYVSGYVDEDEETWLYDTCTVTVNAADTDGGSGRGADAGADENYGYGDGTYINNNTPGEGSGNTKAAYIRLIGPDQKEISLKDDGNGIFSATVPASTEKLTIEAGAEEDHATVSGAGEYTLKEGLNTIDLVITAQNGLQAGYQINITREKAASQTETKETTTEAASVPAAKKDTKSGPPLWIIIAGIVVVLVIAAIVIILLTRKRNNNRHDPDDFDDFDPPKDPGDRYEKDDIDPEIKIDPYYAVTDISPELGARIEAAQREEQRAKREAGASSETKILKFETLDHEPETETTILKFEDLDHQPETETTILKFEDLKHQAETETTILKFEDLEHQAETETTILKFEDLDIRPETETTILKFEDLNHQPETETTIIKFEDLENELKDE